MSNENIARLEEITPKLPSLVVGDPEFYIIYQCEEEAGNCTGMRLFKDKGVAVQRAFMPDGARFVLHSHAETETVIVYAGSLLVVQDGKDDLLLKPGAAHTFPPGVCHSCKAVGDTWMIGVLVPSGEGYP